MCIVLIINQNNAISQQQLMEKLRQDYCLSVYLMDWVTLKGIKNASPRFPFQFIPADYLDWYDVFHQFIGVLESLSENIFISWQICECVCVWHSWKLGNLEFISCSETLSYRCGRAMICSGSMAEHYLCCFWFITNSSDLCKIRVQFHAE